MVLEQRSPERRPSGFLPILAATATAGVSSYFVAWLVPHEIGLSAYAEFAVAWSAIYLIVGGLSGVQQEITRGTRPALDGRAPGRHHARNFGAIGFLVVGILVIGTAWIWVGRAFPDQGWNLVWPLAAGAASYVLVAVMGGTLFGLSRWRAIAAMITVDALLRLAAIGTVLLFTKNVVALVWAVAAPFPLALALVWLFVRKTVAGRSQLDVGYRALTWNSARTVVAAVSTAVMVSGFPLLLGLTSVGESHATVGLFILTITLTRAPLIVVTTALQGYLLVSFRDHTGHFWRRFLGIEAIVVGAGVVLALAGWLFGPVVFGLLFPGQPRPAGWYFAVLVLSSALVGALSVSAPAVLARSRHFVYTAGWLSGAGITILGLLLPADITLRTILALVCGPAVGVLVHFVFLATNRAPAVIAADET